VTTTSGDEFRTKVRRVVSLGVNLAIVCEINELSRRIAQHDLDRAAVRAELVRISLMRPYYNRWLIVVGVGLACAAFSRLFGGDWAVWIVTFLASAAATIVRQELAHRYFNPFLIVVVTAFVAGLIASAASVFRLSPNPQIALASTVLLLVPGVHLINAVQDMIRGHMVIGLVRGMTGAVISLCIALGLLLAMQLLGVTGL
jgi:uncharacterized membrane protein YjjP (DUF1212 family)